jgi:hypothetical protein
VAVAKAKIQNFPTKKANFESPQLLSAFFKKSVKIILDAIPDPLQNKNG